MDLSIIIVNYKTKEKTLRCVESIRKSNLDGITYEIIVVDNNSNDKVGEEIERKFHNEVFFIQNKKNLGMGAGNNVGIKKSKGEYLLILNADIVVFSDSIKKLLEYIKKDKKVGLVAPKLLYPDKSAQQSYFRFPSFFLPLFRRTFLARFGKKYLHNFLIKDFDCVNIGKVDWIMGSCFVVNKSIMEKLGNFDERFFMYLEDTDLCRRIWKFGLSVIYNPHITVIHDHGRGSAKQPWYIALFVNKLAREHLKSWLRYFWKWKGVKKINNVK